MQYDERTDKWLVSRHTDVDALLRGRRLGRSYLHVATHAEMGRPEEPPEHAPFWHVIRHGMLDVEPPDHTRLRRLVSRAFTPRTVERLRETVQSVTDRLVDDALDEGSFDLLATVAEPLPVTVIAGMLGVPEDDGHLLRPWSADICGMYELNPSEQTARTAVRACEEFSAYLVELSRERRARPQDDLITALTEVFADPDALDVARDPNPHASFGAGVHFCLGAALARLELQTSFGTVLRRMPRLELLEEPVWKPGYVIRGLEELRVRA